MILGVIPARWASTRFPGKPLADLCGKPMIWHVYQRCVEAGVLDRIVVATDDRRIQQACERLEIEAILTKDSHPTGTDRVAEVAARIDADQYVNVQGDEPLLVPEAIRLVVEAAQDVWMPVNGCAILTDPADLVDVTVPKVVLAADGSALYLSRSPVPYPKKRGMPYYGQVCVYGFNRSDLEWFARQSPGPVEQSEGIELLRFLEYGHPVHMVQVPMSPVAVDTFEDLLRARAILTVQGIAGDPISSPSP